MMRLFRYHGKLPTRKSVGVSILAVFILFLMWYWHKIEVRKVKMTKKPIPRIIHQTWKKEIIPASLHTMVKSWERNHPEWEYWFWTDRDLWALVQKKFPDYMGLFSAYQSDIERVDVARYMIMYEYGGVYVDLDIESLRPMDDTVEQYPCILGEEPWVHARLFDKMPRIVSNAVIACIPKHPFFRHVLEHLAENRENPTNAIVWRTGPHMITKEISNYVESFDDDDDINSYVHVLDHEVFFPLPEPIKQLRMKHMCTEKRELEAIQKGACRALKKIDYTFKIGENTVTTHHWIGSYRKSLAGSADDAVISVLVPRVIRNFYS